MFILVLPRILSSGFTDESVIRTCAVIILFSITYISFPYFNFV